MFQFRSSIVNHEKSRQPQRQESTVLRQVGVEVKLSGHIAQISGTF